MKSQIFTVWNKIWLINDDDLLYLKFFFFENWSNDWIQETNFNTYFLEQIKGIELDQLSFAFLFSRPFIDQAN